METLKKFIPKNWKEIGLWALAASVVTVLTAYGCIPQTPIPVPPIPVFEPTPAQANGGWVKDDQAVEAVAEQQRFKVFADTPAGKADDPLPESVYLWQAYQKAGIRGPPSKNQGQVGSCVSFGTNNAIERSLVVAIANGKAAFEFKHIAEEVTYGGSRVQVGGGRISGDGSVGAWAADFVKKWGIVPREKVGTFDLSSYSESRCREFGRAGVPAALQDAARNNPVKDITLVKTWDSAKRALTNGYAIAICSSQGFSMQRDANGIAKASGSWAHCMCLDGYTKINGKEYGHIVNSWGDKAHTGPTGPGDPPPCGFYADAAVVNRMLAEGDSWAFSNVVGFPTQFLDWFVRRDEPNRLNIFARHKKEHDRCDFRLAL